MGQSLDECAAPDMNMLRAIFGCVFPDKRKSTCHAKADEQIVAGHRLEDDGQPAAALEHYRVAIQLSPAYARAYLNAGNALLGLERPDEAVASYREAIRLEPGSARAHFNLGRALHEAKRIEEAILSYQEALRIEPGLADAYVAMGCAYEDGEEIGLAISAYKAALSLSPDAGTHYNLGRVLTSQKDYEAALIELEESLRLDPHSAKTYWQLGIAYGKLGFNDRTHEYYLHARHLDPDNYAYHSSFLFNMNHLAGFSNQEVFAEHLAYHEKFCTGYDLPRSYPSTSDPNRRLRIGYVSGDFRQHPVLRFIEPLLEKHHRDQFEVFCYSTLDKPDVVTEKLKTVADQWRETLGLGDDEAAQLIRDDQIDILVDLSGHTGYQRLAVFARKPAPVQATWLGYLGTTGLKAMDYRICDYFTDPPGLTEQYNTEKLARLPDCQWCYRPPPGLLGPSPLPFLTRGYITFGSFNNISKLNEQVLRLWAQVLRNIPASRLLIAAMPESGLAHKRVVEIFEQAGVSSDRLIFLGRQPSAEYYRSCQEVDIALDPFPYNGGTTSIDLLFLGVPVITLAGSRAIARGGVTLLSNLGLTEFIATNENEYIQIASEWARSPDRLAALRADLPGRVATSSLMDEERFIHNMENLYREMWKSWLAKQRA